jgi:hypothetical protein
VARTSNDEEDEAYEGDVRKGIAMLLCGGLILVAVAVGVALGATSAAKNKSINDNNNVPMVPPAEEQKTPAPTGRIF